MITRTPSTKPPKNKQHQKEREWGITATEKKVLADTTKTERPNLSSGVKKILQAEITGRKKALERLSRFREDIFRRDVFLADLYKPMVAETR